MKRIFVVYYSKTGNTKAMANAMVEALQEEPRINVTLKSVEKATNNDLLESDGVIVGTPTYFRAPSWPIKKFIDESIEVYHKLVGKIVGMFTSAGTLFDAITCLKILKEMLEEHGMRVVGKGIFAVGKPNEKELLKCKQYAVRVAACVLGKVQVYETLHEGE